jgi:cytoskeletal protein RodZ
MNEESQKNILNINEIENLSIGEFLKKTREDAGIEINKVANFLKVRANDIKLLEDNDIDKIAKSIYINGLIKSYGKYLKINNDIIEKKLQDLSIKSNIEIKKHLLINVGEDSDLSPSFDLVINILIIAFSIFLIFLMLFSAIENNINLINTDNIISDIKNTQD